jgi:hypothetical protein
VEYMLFRNRYRLDRIVRIPGFNGRDRRLRHHRTVRHGRRQTGGSKCTVRRWYGIMTDPVPPSPAHGKTKESMQG